MKKSYMKEIKRRKDTYNQYVIYVGKCDRYEYENQDLHNTKRRQSI